MGIITLRVLSAMTLLRALTATKPAVTGLRLNK